MWSTVLLACVDYTRGPQWLLACSVAGMRSALMLGLSTILLAQQQPRFEVRSPLVMVPVSVTDANGGFVSDLEASDFLVFDNGRAQKATVDTIDTGVAPIALVVAVQSSGISAAHSAM